MDNDKYAITLHSSNIAKKFVFYNFQNIERANKNIVLVFLPPSLRKLIAVS